MTAGLLARRILGKKLFPVVGRYYRSIFVDLRKVAEFMGREIPPGAHVLDIGGGDGEPLNHLLAGRNDIKITLIDINGTIGGAITEHLRSRVTLLPKTSLRRFMDTRRENPGCIILSDVIHHIPPGQRHMFFHDLHELFAESGAVLLIKDLEPGHIVSVLSYLSDVYITGDRHVRLISRDELRLLIAGVFGNVSVREVGLFAADAPNYMLSVTHS